MNNINLTQQVEGNQQPKNPPQPQQSAEEMLPERVLEM